MNVEALAGRGVVATERTATRRTSSSWSATARSSSSCRWASTPPRSPIDWAGKVITDRPDNNVIFSTHGYLRPGEDAPTRTTDARPPRAACCSTAWTNPTPTSSWSSPATCTVCASASLSVRTAPATPCTRAFTSLTWIPGRSRPTRIHRACNPFEPWKNAPRDLGYTPESDEFVYDADRTLPPGLGQVPIELFEYVTVFGGITPPRIIFR